LAQALNVITAALKQHAQQQKSHPERPIIVIDGLAEGKAWARTQEGKQCLERLFQWCIYVTKERQLAHVILTGNEELVLSLTDQNRLTRGHIKVVGLGDLQEEEARQLILEELPDATKEEAQKITDIFGGFIHDIRGSSRDIQDQLGLVGPMDNDTRSKIVKDIISTRYWLQVERVTAAFAKGREETEDATDEINVVREKEDDGMDPYLDPLKSVYSEAQASQNTAASIPDDGNDTVSYTKLQLWLTLQRLVDSEDGAVAFAELRDDIFDGDKTPLLELMDDDVLGFEIDDSNSLGFSWKVKPATPALFRAFRHIVSDGSLKERFLKVKQSSKRQGEIREVNRERMDLWKERKTLEERKASILSTVELGEKLGRKRVARANLTAVYDSLVKEEYAALVKDRELRIKLKDLKQKRREESIQTESKSTEHEVQNHLKTALLQIMLQKEPSLANRKEHHQFPKLWAAFQELDLTNDGTFNAQDVVRVIKAFTGKEVDIESARKMVRAWDTDDDKHIDFDEFMSMIFMAEKEDEKMRSLIHKDTK
jgi:Ca2+-binding EF-hand superfamily protein